MQLDKRKCRLGFERAAASYDDGAVLQEAVAERQLERLAYTKLRPTRILDLGCGTGFGLSKLKQLYPSAEIIGLDLAHAMLSRARARDQLEAAGFIQADADQLSLADNTVDLVFSNLTLQWCDPEVVFREAYRILRPGGLLLFSSFGPDTLVELYRAWKAVDNAVHVHDFIDMHHLGDWLLAQGYADPVMDMENWQLTYKDVPAMLRDLKTIGANNALVGRDRGLTGKKRFQNFVNQYEKLRSDGKIPATYEVVYGQAWVPQQKTSILPDQGTVTVVPLSQISTRSGRGTE